jgi:hypothetical protein
VSGLISESGIYFVPVAGGNTLLQSIKTWSLRLGIGALILLLLLGIGLYLSINTLVELAIVREGARAAGVDVALEEASVHFDGSGELTGFRVENPNDPNFDSEWFMNVNRARGKVQLGSLFDRVIQIPRVQLDGVDITIERKEDRENYLVILNKIQQNLKEAGERQEPGRKFQIQKLRITDIQVTFSGFPGMNRTLKLADIHMDNVGSESDPLTLTRMTGLVLKTVFSQLLTNPEMIPGTVVAGLNEGLRGLEDLGGVTVKFVGNVTDGAGNVLSEVGGAAGTAVEEIGGAVEGIFGGGEDQTEEETDQ